MNEQKKERKFDHEERERMTKFYKIKIIYTEKTKYNIIRQRLRRKTHNITQDRA